MLDFTDTRTAFSIKSDRDIRRAYFMYKLISYPWLVKMANPMIRFASAIRFPINWIVKPTVYAQFCGGETIDECGPVIIKLKEGGVSSILDYSVEGSEEEKVIEQALQETLRVIDYAASNENIPFTVFKPTAFGNSNALEVLSTSHSPDAESVKEGDKFRQRIQKLCERAYGYGIPIMIDAEDSWYQEIIDQVVMDMMANYNKEKPIVFNTYQMYRHDRLERLKQDHARAKKEQFFMGAKFVRGAYMEKERERAEEMGYEDPIQPDKPATDRDYNLALKYTLENIDDFAVFNGTHNEESSRYMAELMDELKIARNDNRCWFSQLYGMSDHISFNLANEGFNVAKYVPYGPVKFVLPYLMRRAEENTSVKGQTSRELMLLKQEKDRRKR
ncbi:MAG: proline dehydrogenase family protein [Bacteroidales bacterium]|nr:proline dehydrogenase family protein [Bacteroidales bacterium]MDT8432013.1 proline dehydrogenase family protein [Bacteroidales bacterium]